MSEGIEGMDGFVTECEQVDIYKNENYKDREEKKVNKVGSIQIKNEKWTFIIFNYFLGHSNNDLSYHYVHAESKPGPP